MGCRFVSGGYNKKNYRELDDVFPGIEDLQKVVVGTILEDEEEDKVPTEEEHGQTDIPESWIKIATRNESIQMEMRNRLLSEAKKKQRKPHCNKKGGNPNHSKEDGRFTSAESDGSWSIKHPKTSADCDAGTYRKTGKGKQKVWTSIPCGRDSDTNLCGTKNGVRAGRSKKSIKEVELLSTRVKNLIDREWDRLSGEDSKDNPFSDLVDRFQSIQDRDPQFLVNLTYLLSPLVSREKELEKQTSQHGEELDERKKKKVKSPFRGHSDEEIRSACRSRYNLMTFDEFLVLLNRIEAAKKGLQKQPN